MSDLCPASCRRVPITRGYGRVLYPVRGTAGATPWSADGPPSGDQVSAVGTQAHPLEGLAFVTNIHWRLLWLILLLLAGSIYVVVTRKPKLGLDIQGGMRVVLRAKKEDLRTGKWTADNLETTAGIIRSRVDALGVAEPVIYTKG
ncbi:MAG: hypothetical protein FJX72_11500, partial [Armatimonadetes bacterium]|nr:hypothetical protein [Armatimonadota bacterium]